MEKELEDKAIEIGHQVLGTCDRDVFSIIEEEGIVFKSDAEEIAFLTIIDDIAMRCECCGWFVDPGELQDHNGEVVCSDCFEET